MKKLLYVISLVVFLSTFCCLPFDASAAEGKFRDEPIHISVQEKGMLAEEKVGIDGTVIKLTVAFNNTFDMAEITCWRGVVSSLERGDDLPIMQIVAFISVAVLMIVWVWEHIVLKKSFALRKWCACTTTITCTETFLLWLYKSGDLQAGVDFLSATAYYGVIFVVLAQFVCATFSLLYICDLKKRGVFVQENADS